MSASMSDAHRDPSDVPAREELERRVVDLEIRAAFQTRTIEALDAVVREFAGRVEALERTLASLREEVVAVEPWPIQPDGPGGAGPEDLGPP